MWENHLLCASTIQSGSVMCLGGMNRLPHMPLLSLQLYKECRNVMGWSSSTVHVFWYLSVTDCNPIRKVLNKNRILQPVTLQQAGVGVGSVNRILADQAWEPEFESLVLMWKLAWLPICPTMGDKGSRILKASRLAILAKLGNFQCNDSVSGIKEASRWSALWLAEWPQASYPVSLAHRL